MKMRKILFFVTLAFLALNACEESVEYNVPQISDADKTIHVILDNVPENYLGEDIYLFIISNEGIYSTEKAFAVNDTIITLNPPSGHSAFDIVAFIPGSANWQAGDNFSVGYYSAVISVKERDSYFITLSWYYSTYLSYLGLSYTTILADLDLSATIYDQGDIIYLDATINPIYNSPVKSVKYYLDNSEIISYSEEPYAYSLNTFDINAGEHILKVIATNEEGHSAEDEENIWINSNENEAPSVEITSHYNGEEITHGNVELIYANISDPENQIDHVVFKINTTTVATLTEEPFEYLWETLDNSTGSNTITVTAYDDQGAFRSDVINVSLIKPDNYTPQITITDPYDGEYFTQSETIYIYTTASDVENNIDVVYFYIDGGYVSEDTSSPYSYNFDSSTLSIGEHTIKATVYDTDGAYSSDQITINIE